MDGTFSASPIDYPQRARRRQERQRSTATCLAPAKPYRGPSPNRYARLNAPPPKPEPAPVPVAAPVSVEPVPTAANALTSRIPLRRPPREAPPDLEPLDISLKTEFARVRDDQTKRDSKRPLLRKPKRPILAAVTTVGVVALLIAAAVLGPVVYRGTRAYQDVFEEPVPRQEVPFVAAVNPEGTSVIVEATEPAAAAEIPEWNGEDRITILLLGVDKREEEASRSDTMILVNIDPATKAAKMMAIPRDLQVIVPGYGVHKVNAAYAFGDVDKVPGGGPALTIQTIETNFGIRVDYYAQVDFEGFVKIVDTLGGITLDVPYPIKDDEYPSTGNNYMRVYFQAGWQQMDGERVLQYARTRHDDGDGRRSARQQQVLLALREQAISLDLLPKATELLAEVGDALRTDLQPSQAIQLARLASEIDPAAIEQVSLNPALTEQIIPGEPYYLIADWDQVGSIMSEFTGAEVVPPMSAIANPNLDIEIRIEDGTFNPGLGARVADVLFSYGFTNVTVTDKPDLGNYPTSAITIDPTELTTGYWIASVLGIDLTAISFYEQPGSAVAGVTPTPTGEQVDGSKGSGQVLVLVLGDDAPDPAYFTSEPFEEEAVPIDDAGIEDQTGGDAVVGGE